MFGCRADTAVMLILDLTKADACELAATRLAHLAKHGAGDYILYILYTVRTRHRRLYSIYCIQCAHGACDYILYSVYSAHTAQVVELESSYRTILHWKLLQRD